MEKPIDYVLRAQNTEVVDRVRRLETRMTAFMEWMGFNTGAQRPVWSVEDGVPFMTVPTPNVSVFDLIRSVPDEYDGNDPINVRHKGDVLAQFYVGDGE